MAISTKEKELVAVAVSVASGCKPCANHHITRAREEDATTEEIRAAIDTALATRRRALEFMEAHALAQLGENREAVDFGFLGVPDRVDALVSVASAYAVNCVTSLKHNLAAAEMSGASHADVEEITNLATLIKHEAASHVVNMIVNSNDRAA